LISSEWNSLFRYADASCHPTSATQQHSD